MSDPDKTWTGEILTISGVKVDLERPAWDSINIVDIAHALSMQCRYNGHVPTFYSVAEHSCRVVDVLLNKGHDQFALRGLLHDAAEAYLGDLVSPMKRISDIGALYKKYESKMDNAIGLRFDIPLWIHEPLIKEADLEVYQWEVEHIRSGIKSGLPQQEARNLFLDYYVRYAALDAS